MSDLFFAKRVGGKVRHRQIVTDDVQVRMLEGQRLTQAIPYKKIGDLLRALRLLRRELRSDGWKEVFEPATPSVQPKPAARAATAATTRKANPAAKRLLPANARSKSLCQKLISVRDRMLNDVEQEYAIVFGSKVPRKELLAIQQEFGLQLPAAYVDLLATLGPFKVVHQQDRAKPYARILQSRFELLAPQALVKVNRAERKAYVKYVDEQTRDNVNRAVLFQTRYGHDSYFAFRVTDGSVHLFEHDDHFRWSPRGLAFERHILGVLRSVA